MVTVPYGTNPSNLIATFTTTPANSPVIVGSITQISGATTNNFTNPVTYTVTNGSVSQNYLVTVKIADPAEITAFSIGDSNGIISENTILVTVPYGTDLSSLVAIFTTVANVPVTVVGIIQVSGVTANNFTNPLTYIVTNGGASQNYAVTVAISPILFCGTQSIGSVINIANQDYLVVGDGGDIATYGIQSDAIKNGIIAGTLKVCTSHVTNMSNLFDGANSFNQPIGNWDTSNVTIMLNMFRSNQVFNQPINNWNTSNVTNMQSMFGGATAFNQPLDSWNTSNVTNMVSMFRSASSFNQNISNANSG